MAESHKAHILLMEDDPGLARLFEKRLEREGYRVDIAYNGEEGLAMYEAGSYDLLVLDQVMPVYTGLEVIRFLSERGPLPPTIMVTGTGSEQIAVEAMKLGAGDYIVKDVDGGYFELLPTVIEQVLRQRRLVEEKEQASAALQESHRRLEETLAQLQATQEQVIRQERLAAVGQLAAGIAHDFNSLLTAIILSAEMIQREPNTPESAVKNLAQIVAQSQRAAHLIRQLLDFGRKSLRRLQPLDLGSVLQDYVRELALTIPSHVRIVQEIAPGDYPLRADLGQMRQILTNLTDNAVDAMPQGGRLTFRLSSLQLSPGESTPCPEMSPGRWWSLSVSDTGVGIPPEVLPHLYEPFFTTKEVGEGVGLGLAQVYGIIMQHGGQIAVESQVGQGTTFTLYFPAPEVEGEGQQETRAALAFPTTGGTRQRVGRQRAFPSHQPGFEEPPPGQGEILLLADGDETVLEVSGMILEVLGYRVLPAGSSQQVLNLYDRHRAEIALTVLDADLCAPDGPPLYTALKKKDPDFQCILLAHHPTRWTPGVLAAQGIREWIVKPFSPEEIGQAIRKAIDLGTANSARG